MPSWSPVVSNPSLLQPDPPRFGRGGKPAPRPAERVDWDSWRHWFGREWKQGEHLSIIGPTGTGKTTLEIELLKIRDYVVFVATKRADELIESLENRGYSRIPAWPKTVPDGTPRWLLWPRGASSMDAKEQHQARTILHDAFHRIYEGPRNGVPGRWAICVDEARVVSDPAYLGLRADINQLLIQARSVKSSIILGFQRPSWVPQEAYDQPSHLFIAGDNDRRNVQRFREIGGVDGERVAQTIQHLAPFEWAHVDARPGHGEVQVVKLPRSLARRR